MSIRCPESNCRFENEVSATECVRCNTPLQGYVRLLDHPAHLFNQGLTSARNGEFERARDLFAAVVYWCPKDLEARNALAMACLALHDLLEARRQWEMVLAQVPTDTIAKRGLHQLQTHFQPAASPSPSPSVRTFLRRRKTSSP